MRSDRLKKLVTIVLGSSVIAVVSSSVAHAQGRLLVFEEEVIQGEIDKPEAFYILSPSNLEYESVPPEESFLEELYETVDEAPF